MDFSNFPEWSYQTIQAFGYPAIFFAHLVSAGSVFFPLPAWPLLFILAKTFNPVLLVVSSALGAALGETSAWGLGRGGNYVLEKSRSRYLDSAKEWFAKKRGFWILVIFAATPLPFDAAGLAAGTCRYGLKKFWVAAFLGKLIMFSVLTFGGYYSIDWILKVFNANF